MVDEMVEQVFLGASGAIDGVWTGIISVAARLMVMTHNAMQSLLFLMNQQKLRPQRTMLWETTRLTRTTLEGKFDSTWCKVSL